MNQEDQAIPFREESEVSVSRRRKLPHRKYADSIYFVTWRINKNQPKLKPDEKELIARALKHFNSRK
ncbi:MAG TPA: hypothetical protein VI958_04420, partial [Acidobacteriota bacterium]